jgi:hypothetical protein
MYDGRGVGVSLSGPGIGRAVSLGFDGGSQVYVAVKGFNSVFVVEDPDPDIRLVRGERVVNRVSKVDVVPGKE